MALRTLDLLVKDPIGYIVRTCHMDRALARVIMQDERALWR
jgi:hypothetical protein